MQSTKPPAKEAYSCNRTSAPVLCIFLLMSALVCLSAGTDSAFTMLLSQIFAIALTISGTLIHTWLPHILRLAYIAGMNITLTPQNRHSLLY